MITDILPPAVAAEDTFTDHEVELFPEEERLVANAVDKRRREFTTGRHCARTALGRLGVAPAPLLPGERRAPVWPEGVVGSITHCAGYRAAAVGLTSEIRTIGIDAEPNEPTPPGVLGAIALPPELAMVSRLGAAGNKVAWDRLLFSAKETVYKAWFPLTRLWLGFEEAELTINPDDGTFSARILVEPPVVDGAPLTGFTGRWLVREGFVVTAIAVPALTT
ncbi:4'-phosphopantetheinyl transferase family protein [Saccharothrix algeriensis]|uniref:4'-phosphopantetheinyl transferase EntD n=1 Tax=Saccharothrix algeriensis TaxID=173560 RepID=A0A8T8HV79_9PSEU|nr:4'-phosphopantetheinyl transferase superfamily protein [Saccharothrix algeriensis]MBM7813974.1 4'-phosphopantetheinyl transferase EntD [Saccharothrix algeriensis]QTR02386.1 4'-phosphopantetheinyl transferase superfamily protein [Saccharothrix algeriensis]